MPGTFRFLLAVAVVLCHLIHTPYYRDLGYYAVRAFFVLSGFAMTAALNEVYGFDGKRFWINRFLRLVPPYLTVPRSPFAATLSKPPGSCHDGHIRRRQPMSRKTSV
jgi:peptidoglycan/LPS O-acetylase OafA/YrhL